MPRDATYDPKGSRQLSIKMPLLPQPNCQRTRGRQMPHWHPPTAPVLRGRSQPGCSAKAFARAPLETAPAHSYSLGSRASPLCASPRQVGKAEYSGAPNTCQTPSPERFEKFLSPTNLRQKSMNPLGSIVDESHALDCSLRTTAGLSSPGSLPQGQGPLKIAREAAAAATKRSPAALDATIFRTFCRET